ncbi:hypothetical protein V493_02099 [Pseudogymnoascus sp. VKM F-4281 (FW-2241)]|nr:hypothetical protein V493_02099 [Pseudogymnoascus sp. VKM F-4281 (FW-2241)]
MKLPLLIYIDAAKNKYFKIVADPAALYSKTAVRKRKADEAVATEVARVEKANRERVTRSAAAKKLDKETGRGNGRLDALKGFVGEWEESNPVDKLSGTPRWRVFDVDARDINKVVYSDGFDVVYDTFPISGGWVGRGSPSRRDNRGNCNVNLITYSASYTHTLTSSTTGEDTTIRCASAAPLHSPYLFAVACDDRPIFLLNSYLDEVELTSPVSESTILALSFLTESPHVILAGKRSGQIPVIDLRVDGGEVEEGGDEASGEDGGSSE